MKLLDLVPNMRKVGANEYHGPCPACGSKHSNPALSDRFSVRTDGEIERWFCRNCGNGDAIDYLREYEGKSYREACAILGKEIREQDEHSRPQLRKPAGTADTFQPRQCQDPAEVWQQHATKLVDWAHQQLLGNQQQLQWLADRGLDLNAVERYGLGWNPGENGRDLYRVREAWGLKTILKDDQKTKKKLWLPIGLVIPCYQDDKLHRIRIRRPEGEPRYYLVPGSGTAPMIQGRDQRAFVIVESELDALMIHASAGDITGAISQGNSTAKPDEASHAMLQQALSILVALDSDDAGMLASVWWRKNYPQAERWPVPVGKDPGDSYKAGVNIRQWIVDGLPPVLTMPKRKPVPVRLPAAHDDTGKVPRETPPETAGAREAASVQTITVRDGRIVHLTDDSAAARDLVKSGKIVCSSREIALIKQCGADPAQAALFLDVKQAFPGATIVAATPPEEPSGQQEPQKPTYRGKFAK